MTAWSLSLSGFRHDYEGLGEGGALGETKVDSTKAGSSALLSRLRNLHHHYTSVVVLSIAIQQLSLTVTVS